MQKWEYKNVSIDFPPREWEAKLEQWGNDGWELVGIVPARWTSQKALLSGPIETVISVNDTWAVFKRPKQ